jgi:hypothetical protein
MAHGQAFLSGLALAFVFALSFAVTSESKGYGPIRYCGQVKAHGHWCGSFAHGGTPGVHSWDKNTAVSDEGTTLIRVCQRLRKPSTGRVVAGVTCGLGYATHWYGDVRCVCYEANVMQQGLGNYRLIGIAWA